MIAEIPKPEKRSKWSDRALEAMRGILEHGYTGWLEREIAAPSHQDRDWAEFVLKAAEQHEEAVKARVAKAAGTSGGEEG